MKKHISTIIAIGVVFAGIIFAEDKSAEELQLEKLASAYPGLQTAFHSGKNQARVPRGYGHQGITWGGGRWYLFGTDHIYGYENDDFSVDQAKLKIKNEAPFGHTDFKGSDIEHMGAPHFHAGKVYSFSKSSNKTPFAKARMRLLWFSADDLSYKEGSYIDLAVPPDKEGNPRVVSGGPFIQGDVFYSALAKKTLGGKKLPINAIGKFSLESGKFLGAIQVTESYGAPQALGMDKKENFYVMETRGHLKKYTSDGKYLGTVFEAPVKAIYEGFYYDEKSGVMTVSLTKPAIHIARIKLKQIE